MDKKIWEQVMTSRKNVDRLEKEKHFLKMSDKLDRVLYTSQRITLKKITHDQLKRMNDTCFNEFYERLKKIYRNVFEIKIIN